MTTPHSSTRHLQIRMAILIFLIVIANLAFVSLVVELASPLFVLGLLFIPADLFVGILAESWLLVGPATAVFMWLQYRYLIQRFLLVGHSGGSSPLSMVADPWFVLGGILFGLTARAFSHQLRSY